MAIDMTTSAGRVRLLIGDTNESDFIFSADEITAMLVLGNSDVFGAAALCCQSIAACAARSAIAYRILNEFSVDKKNIPKYYLDLAAKYEAKIGSTDTDDYMVDWGFLVSKIDGRDETEYESDADEEYYQDHHYDGNI